MIRSDEVPKIERKVTALVATLVAVCLPASATVHFPEPISYYYDAAETVAWVYVMSGELLIREQNDRRYQCGQRVKAQVLESFKGEEGMIEFVMDGMVLNLGEEYLVFIERAGPERDKKRKLRGDRPCGDVVKTREASWLTTARFIHLDKPGQSVIPEGTEIKFQSVKILALEVDGEVIKAPRWELKRHAVIPDEMWMYGGAFEWDSFRDFLLSETNQAKAEE